MKHLTHSLGTKLNKWHKSSSLLSFLVFSCSRLKVAPTALRTSFVSHMHKECKCWDGRCDACLIWCVSPPGLLAVAEINEAVDRGDSRKLLASLLLPSCGIDEVSAANACRYLTLLTRFRQRKAQVRPRRPLVGCLLGLISAYLCTCPVQADGRWCSGACQCLFPAFLHFSSQSFIPDVLFVLQLL